MLSEKKSLKIFRKRPETSDNIRKPEVSKSVQDFNLAKYKKDIQIHKLSLGFLNYENLKTPYRTNNKIPLENESHEKRTPNKKDLNIFEYFSRPHCKINIFRGNDTGIINFNFTCTN